MPRYIKIFGFVLCLRYVCLEFPANASPDSVDELRTFCPAYTWHDSTEREREIERELQTSPEGSHQVSGHHETCVSCSISETLTSWVLIMEVEGVHHPSPPVCRGKLVIQGLSAIHSHDLSNECIDTCIDYRHFRYFHLDLLKEWRKIIPQKGI